VLTSGAAAGSSSAGAGSAAAAHEAVDAEPGMYTWHTCRIIHCERACRTCVCVCVSDLKSASVLSPLYERSVKVVSALSIASARATLLL
jgi:hypothetical protein